MKVFMGMRMMMCSCTRRVGLTALVMLACVFLPHTLRAQLTGISYTATPLVERTYFGDNAGLEDGYLYGGRLGFGFGEYAELSGIYLISRDIRTDFRRFSAGEVAEEAFEMLPRRDVDLTQYGANLKFNLGRSRLFPFVTFGTGILEIDPQNLSTTRVIYLSGSVGLQYAITDNFAVLGQLQSLTYRYAPGASLLSDADLFDLGIGRGDVGHVRVANYAARVGVQVYLGGRSRGELTDVDLALRDQFSHGFSGVRLQIEPMGGVIDFTGDLGFRERQRMAGVRAGFDLGPYLGVRGFYWRGLEEGSVSDFDDLQAYGGELHLSFGSLMQGVVPRVVLGAGYLDVLQGYAGNGEVEPVDRPFATGGAEVTIPLWRAVHVHGGIRALLMSGDDPEMVSDPGEIEVSYFYSAGISFGLGGGRSTAPPATRPVPTAPVTSARSPELDRISRQIDSLVAVSRQIEERADGAAPREPAPRLEIADDGRRWVTIPIPEEGEFYVRYGEPGRIQVRGASDAGTPVVTPGARAATAGDLDAIVRDVLRQEMGVRDQSGTVIVRSDVQETEQRLLARIAELESRLAEQRRGAAASGAARTQTVLLQREPTYSFESVLPFVGLTLAPEAHVLFGIRAHIRSLSFSSAHFLPDLSAAVGSDGLSYALNGNVGFPLGISIRSFRPYAGLGLGFLTTGGSQLVFNLLAGAEQASPYGRMFVEYMSQDFFSLNRLALGYRLSF